MIGLVIQLLQLSQVNFVTYPIIFLFLTTDQPGSSCEQQDEWPDITKFTSVYLLSFLSSDLF